MTEQIDKYITLLEEYLQGRIAPGDFPKKFLAILHMPRDMDEELYVILDQLFGDIEVFVSDPELYEGLSQERPGWYLDEPQFRERAATALQKLKAYAAKHSSESTS